MTSTTHNLQALITHAQQLTDTITRTAETDAARDDELFRQAYALGYAAGHDIGHARAEHHQQQDAEHLAAHIRDHCDQPTCAELEHRRWGPGGRQAFAHPRPGDHPGGPTTWPQDQPAPADDPWATMPNQAA